MSYPSSQRHSWKRKKNHDDDEDDDDHNNYDHPRHLVSRRNMNKPVERSIASIVSAADTAELERHYTFLPPNAATKSTSSTTSSSTKSTWQQRMVQHYHQHLYKEFVIADFSAVLQQQHQYHRIGLRWRSREEVEQGKGERTCGNKHCPSFVQRCYYDALAPPPPPLPPPLRATDGNHDNQHDASTPTTLSSSVTSNGIVLQKQWLDYYNYTSNESNAIPSHGSKHHHHDEHDEDHDHDHDNDDHFRQQQQQQQREKDEWSLLQQIPHGIGLNDYEVHFRYQEPDDGDGVIIMVSKHELVKLRLCLKCAPLLFLSKVYGATTTAATAATTANAAVHHKNTTKHAKDDHDTTNKTLSTKRKKYNNNDDDQELDVLFRRAAWAARVARRQSAITSLSSSS